MSIVVWFEVISVVLALLGIVLTILENRNCWIANILSSIFFVKVFNDSELYGQVLLQFVFIIASIYGYICWGATTTTKITRIGYPTVMLLLIISIGIGVDLNYYYPKLNWADAALTIGSIFATYLTARKFLESWILWSIVDLASIGVFFQGELYVTAGLYLIYTSLSLIGFKQWHASISNEPQH